MATETREKVSEMFDTVSDGFRSTMESGRRSQESFFRAMGDTCRHTVDFDGVAGRGERMTRDFMPFVAKNFTIIGECFDAGFRGGLDVFKAACDVTFRTDDADMYRRSRQVWDAAFNAVRSNFDALGKAGTRTMENWSEFCRTTCCDEPHSKTGGSGNSSNKSAK